MEVIVIDGKPHPLPSVKVSHPSDVTESNTTIEATVLMDMLISERMYDTVHISNGDLLHEFQDVFVSSQRTSTEKVGIELTLKAQESSLRRMHHKL